MQFVAQLRYATGRRLGQRRCSSCKRQPPTLWGSWLKPGLSLREVEKALLEITLHATAGNRTHAAELLGVSLRTVRNKIREHGLPPRRLT